ncbi:acyltransferase [Plantactinospora siamensis]|uniref:Acyltransferase n=1 Tax=Plantactinospora siamensis TaxID=555372 RepID=A0ABV6NZ29_9ACTN
MRRLQAMVRNTPAERERYVDLLRALAIVAVISGHWLMTVIDLSPTGRLGGHNALQELTGARVVTWFFQVLPIFFLVGGYANAASLTARVGRGGGAVDWLIERSGRLLRPTSAFLAATVVIALVARAAGGDPHEIRQVIWFITVPLWFLGPYLLVVLLTPPMFALHRRAGPAVPLVLVGLVALGDAGRLTGPAWLGYGNFLFGWLLPHQVGFAWRTGGLRIRAGAAAALAVGGLAALILLTVPGPYPISMINLPGQRIQNMSPPSVALLSLATAQLGLILLLRGPAERMLRRTGPWTVVVALNSVVLTIFLWHLTALILAGGALDALGVLPTQPAGSTGWWLWRLPWLAVLTFFLVPLVLVFGPVEARAGRRRAGGTSGDATPGGDARARPGRAGVRGWVAVGCYLAVIAGLVANSRAPRSGPEPLGIPTGALAAYLVGAGGLRLLRAGVPSVKKGPLLYKKR